MSLSKQINNEALDEDLKIYKNIVDMTKKQVKEFGRERINNNYSSDLNFQKNLKEYIDDVSKLIIFKINKFINTDDENKRYLNLEDIISSYNSLATFLSNHMNENIISPSDINYIDQEMTKLYVLIDRLYVLIESSDIRNKQELNKIRFKLKSKNYTPLQFIEYYKDFKSKEEEEEEEEMKYPINKDLDDIINQKQKEKINSDLELKLKNLREDYNKLGKLSNYFEDQPNQALFNRLSPTIDKYNDDLKKYISLNDYYKNNIKNINKPMSGEEVKDGFKIKYDFTNQNAFKTSYNNNLQRLDNQSSGDFNRFYDILLKAKDKIMI